MKDFYFAKEPTNYTVGPMGGPMYRTWDFEEKSCPSSEQITQHMESLVSHWSEIVDNEIGIITHPLAFTGDKAHRLLAFAKDEFAPPWGGWSYLSKEESKRRTFTYFRAAINKAIAPHEMEETMSKFKWKYLLLIVALIPIVKYGAAYLGKNAAESVNHRESATSTQQPTDIRVVVSSQDAQGVTQNNMDINFLKNLEDYTVTRLKQKTKEILVARGLQGDEPNITSEAVYVGDGKNKLAVIRVKSNPGPYSLFITGIVGNELRRITCLSSEPIPISYGACGEKVQEVFGFAIGK
jgi:hypothetical protein